MRARRRATQDFTLPRAKFCKWCVISRANFSRGETCRKKWSSLKSTDLHRQVSIVSTNTFPGFFFFWRQHQSVQFNIIQLSSNGIYQPPNQSAQCQPPANGPTNAFIISVFFSYRDWSWKGVLIVCIPWENASASRNKEVAKWHDNFVPGTFFEFWCVKANYLVGTHKPRRKKGPKTFSATTTSVWAFLPEVGLLFASCADVCSLLMLSQPKSIIQLTLIEAYFYFTSAEWEREREKQTWDAFTLLVCSRCESMPDYFSSCRCLFEYVKHRQNLTKIQSYKDSFEDLWWRKDGKRLQKIW